MRVSGLQRKVARGVVDLEAARTQYISVSTAPENTAICMHAGMCARIGLNATLKNTRMQRRKGRWRE